MKNTLITNKYEVKVMGGRAFGFEAKRMDILEYEAVLRDTLQKINGLRLLNLTAEGVLSVRDKKDFGDIDILVKKEMFSFENFLEDYQWDYKDYRRNGDVISLLDHEDRQIDLILTPIYLFDVHFNYLAYNDLGNLVGRIAKAVGLKYGHDGLTLIVRDNDDPTRKIGEIKIYEDNERIYNLLGLGQPKDFENMEQVYEFIIGSKYYHKDLFLLEKQSHHARVRDRKRKSYHGMLDYIKEHDSQDLERRKYTIFETLNLLPESIQLKYIKMVSENDQKKYNKTLFNGNIVREVTGLEGKELGAFMAEIKDNIDLSGNIRTQIGDAYHKKLKQGAANWCSKQKESK